MDKLLNPFRGVELTREQTEMCLRVVRSRERRWERMR